LFFPRFKLTREVELATPLSAMGMPSAFRQADFSGMTGKKDLFLSKVFHKAFVEVNEEGTEAAAATAAVMTRAAVARPLLVRADRPFLFLIWDRKSGSILFLGRLTQPE
jgi:serpin B